MRSSSSNGGQAVVETDAWLPYQRFKAVSELDRMRAELELLDQKDSPSTERSSPSTVRPTTESLMNSDPPNGLPAKEKSQPLASRSNKAGIKTWALKHETPPPQVAQKNPRRVFSPPWEGTRISLGSESPPSEDYQPGRTNDPDRYNAPRTQQPTPEYSRPWSPDFSVPKRPATSNNRVRDLTDRLSSLTPGPAPRASTPHDYVRTISPKPVVDGEDRVLFDRYTRAADDEVPDHQARIPSRYRRSIVAPFTKHMTPQPEEDEESVDGAAEPPSIARTRAFEAQDQEMTSRTN
ncbi:hypothetical protein H2198_000139 [Neophaeococcomyces mojaviensis]|uniref:Uncharacterized protein n=1 Tax=Neophaeococcomyces mojaviensis TaxID=3383035 RepID=A0ACC3AL29_9EURO|nr:hypothetical protein H2198_000139 [Knufia sp. JES_112]